MWLFTAAISWAGDPENPTVSSDDVTSWRVGWDVAHLQPAVPESPAIGPDRLAAGPGVVAWSDPLASTVVVLRDGGIVSAIPTSGLDDLAFAGGDLLLLEGRVLRRVDIHGRALAKQDLPALVPADVALEVRGDLVVGVDVLGNAHAIASLDRGLSADDGHLVASPHVRRTADGLSVDGASFPYDGKVAGSVVGDWLLVEKVFQIDGRVRVEREAVSLRNRRVVPLPKPALYVPTRSIAIATDGSLWTMVPTTSALLVQRVSP
jgi:hypothetical protein